LNPSQAHGLPTAIVATSPGKPWVASLGFEAIILIRNENKNFQGCTADYVLAILLG